MNEIIEFLVRHGAPVLFAALFVEQIGIPLPAAPWLLAAGASAGAGRMSWLVALFAATFGSLVADAVWFYLGRYRGRQVLGLLCRISLEPDSCARRTQDLFTRYGMRGVIIAKFFPGLSTLAPPMAGSAGVAAPRFFLFDAAGSIGYSGSFVLAGFLFSRQLEKVIAALAGLGRGALYLAIGAATLYIGYKYFKRRSLLNDLRMARITVDELYALQEAGESLVILDLRPLVDFDLDPSLIRGALHIPREEVEAREKEIPRDRDIVLYCSCPNEVTSARIALLLRGKGILRVRPLLGGIDAWRNRNYPLDARGTPPVAVVSGGSSVEKSGTQIDLVR